MIELEEHIGEFHHLRLPSRGTEGTYQQVGLGEN